MSEVEVAQTLAATGSAFLIVFAVLNFGIEQIWFPRPHRLSAGNMRPVPPLTGDARRGHIVMGTIEGLCFIVGVILIVMGCAILGTRGYGSF